MLTQTTRLSWCLATCRSTAVTAPLNGVCSLHEFHKTWTLYRISSIDLQDSSHISFSPLRHTLWLPTYATECEDRRWVLTIMYIFSGGFMSSKASMGSKVHHSLSSKILSSTCVLSLSMLCTSRREGLAWQPNYMAYTGSLQATLYHSAYELLSTLILHTLMGTHILCVRHTIMHY